MQGEVTGALDSAAGEPAFLLSSIAELKSQVAMPNASVLSSHEHCAAITNRCKVLELWKLSLPGSSSNVPFNTPDFDFLCVGNSFDAECVLNSSTTNGNLPKACDVCKVNGLPYFAPSAVCVFVYTVCRAIQYEWESLLCS